MIHARTLIGVCTAILAGLAMLSFAAAAQAEPLFTVNGSPLESNEEMAGELGGPWLFYIGSNVITHCATRLTVVLYTLLFLLEIDEGYKYEKCVTLIKEVEAESCNPKEITLNSKSHFFLHEGETYMLVGPAEGSENLGVIDFGEECALGEEAAVTGSYVMECDCETEALVHTFATAPVELFGDTLKIGSQASKMSGTETTKLAGANTGQKWSVIG
jgi:hypothetical protein